MIWAPVFTCGCVFELPNGPIDDAYDNYTPVVQCAIHQGVGKRDHLRAVHKEARDTQLVKGAIFEAVPEILTDDEPEHVEIVDHGDGTFEAVRHMASKKVRPGVGLQTLYDKDRVLHVFASGLTADEQARAEAAVKKFTDDTATVAGVIDPVTMKAKRFTPSAPKPAFPTK